MKLKQLLLIHLFFIVTLVNPSTRAFANFDPNTVHQNIEQLKDIKSSVQKNYGRYIDINWNLRIKTLYLQRMIDYTEVLTHLLAHYKEAAAQAQNARTKWHHEFEEIDRQYILNSGSTLHSSNRAIHTDALLKLKNIRDDLDSILNYWADRCSEAQIERVFARNRPENVFLIERFNEVPPKENWVTHFHTSATNKTAVCSALGASAAVSGCSPTQSVALGVASFLLWTAKDSYSLSSKLKTQWDLIEEIRAFQDSEVKRVRVYALNSIRNVCYKSLLPAFGNKVATALTVINKQIQLAEWAQQNMEQECEELRNSYIQRLSNLRF